jgi:hypothetical protein
MYFTWYKRLNVALDVARALAYLHEHQVYIYIIYMYLLFISLYVCFFFFPIRLWYYLLAMICNFFFFWVETDGIKVFQIFLHCH